MPRRPDDRRRLGRRGERIAALHYRLRGYRVLARNLRTPVGEIDLLARRGHRLVICEVKTRRSDRETTISHRQKRRIARAAVWALERWGNADDVIRIDVLAVRFLRHFPYLPRFRYFPAAFGEEVLE